MYWFNGHLLILVWTWWMNWVGQFYLLEVLIFLFAFVYFVHIRFKGVLHYRSWHNGLGYRVPIGPKVSFKVQRNFILVRLKVNLQARIQRGGGWGGTRARDPRPRPRPRPPPASPQVISNSLFFFSFLFFFFRNFLIIPPIEGPKIKKSCETD